MQPSFLDQTNCFQGFGQRCELWWIVSWMLLVAARYSFWRKGGYVLPRSTSTRVKSHYLSYKSHPLFSISYMVSVSRLCMHTSKGRRRWLSMTDQGAASASRGWLQAPLMTGSPGTLAFSSVCSTSQSPIPIEARRVPLSHQDTKESTWICGLYETSPKAVCKVSKGVWYAG